MVSQASCYLLLDDIYNTGLGESAEIAKLVSFASDDLAHNATHNLSKANVEQNSIF